MTIPVHLQTKELEATPRIKDYVDKKFSKLDRYIDSIDEVRVELRYNAGVRSDADRYIAQVTVRGKNLLLRAEERSDDIHASIDTAQEKLQRRIEKFKGKHSRIRVEAEPLFEADTSGKAEDSLAANIVRRKKMTLEPMMEKEALEQMQLLGHEEFFLFLNSHSGEVNVLYRRRDGLYGLLEAATR